MLIPIYITGNRILDMSLRMFQYLHLFMFCILILLENFILFLVQLVSSAPGRIQAMGQVLQVGDWEAESNASDSR